MRTFTFTQVPVASLGSTDLQAAASEAAFDDSETRAFRVTIYNADGTQQEAETAEALFLPAESRLGIAWGGDATWADANDVEQGIAMWLNDADAWEQAR